MRRGWRAAITAGAGAFIGAASSCGPPAVATAGLNAVQAGTVAWVHGDVEGAERVPLVDLFATCHWALTRLDFGVQQETLHPTVGFIRASASGTRVKIVLERLSSVATRFSIRVGAWGDETVSRLILEEIQEELKRAQRPDERPSAPTP